MTNKKNINLSFLFLVSTFLFIPLFLNAFHLPSKHCPFFENDFTVNLYPTKKHTLAIEGIFGTISTAFKRNGKSGGTPELYGEYELNSVVDSLQAVNGSNPGFKNPFQQLPANLQKKSLKFGVSEKIHTVGCTLSDTHWFFDNTLFVGAWIPIISMQSMNRYILKEASTFNVADQNLIDKVRRDTHQALGFYDNGATRTGFGDLDLFVGYRAFWDHKLLMKSIIITPKMGLILPTGVHRDVDNPSTIPFMGDGHLGIHGEIHSQFELKQDLRLGFIIHGAHQVQHRKKERHAVFKEPSIFSALVTHIKVKPGFTLALAPYLVLENILDNVHFQVKYTYLRHGADDVSDYGEYLLDDPKSSSYLTKRPTNVITQKDIDDNKFEKWNNSKWRSHYVTLQLMFDTRQTLTSWKLDPNFYVSYDIPCAGRGISKMHQISLGGSVHF